LETGTRGLDELLEICRKSGEFRARPGTANASPAAVPAVALIAHGSLGDFRTNDSLISGARLDSGSSVILEPHGARG
jgi:hypothetical protein